MAVQVNTSGREYGHVPSISEHSPEQVTSENLEAMRAELLDRITRARDSKP